MLAIIFEILDGWINDENKEARREGLRAIAKCEFRVVGQMALMEAKLDLHIAVTGDVDAFNNAHHSVMTKWNDQSLASPSSMRCGVSSASRTLVFKVSCLIFK